MNKNRMENKELIKKYFFPCAMYYGLLVGLVLAVKFAFLPLGFRFSIFQLLFIVGTLLVPLVLCYTTKLFRDKFLGGKILWWRAYLFSYLTFFFASLIVAVAHLIYFQFIDQGYIYGEYMEQINLLRSENITGDTDYVALLDSLTENLNQLNQLSAMELTVQFFLQNLTFSTFFSFIPAIFIKKNS